MELVDPKYPKSTRYSIYVILLLLFASVLTLGMMSILGSLSQFAHVGESASELRYQAQEEIDERFSQDYVQEENSEEIISE